MKDNLSIQVEMEEATEEPETEEDKKSEEEDEYVDDGVRNACVSWNSLYF